ncbi:CAP domain-containing protein [Polaromonas sp. YR568]|uniref:CAP domain-containing protein n=1 Tax=Polaromonas sp. YR568 TaxID=1855301 RepID=UPI0031376ECE
MVLTPSMKRTDRWNATGVRIAMALLLGGVLGLVALWPQAVQAHAKDDDADYSPLLNALNTLRQRGCVGSPVPAGQVNKSRVLSQVAERVANGQKLDEALRNEGYRAQRASQISIVGQGITSSLSRGQVGESCKTIMYGPLSEAGFHQHGAQVWIIMAAPLAMPDTSRSEEIQAQILSLVNDARSQPRRCGNDFFAAVPPLRLNSALYRTANAYANELATHSYFSHTDRDGYRIDYRASRAGYSWLSVGENLAAGQSTPEAAVQGWLNSPGHCASIMSPVFEEMGVAVAVNTKSSQGVYWVQVFGKPR